MPQPQGHMNQFGPIPQQPPPYEYQYGGPEQNEPRRGGVFNYPEEKFPLGGVDPPPPMGFNSPNPGGNMPPNPMGYPGPGMNIPPMDGRPNVTGGVSPGHDSEKVLNSNYEVIFSIQLYCLLLSTRSAGSGSVRCLILFSFMKFNKPTPAPRNLPPSNPMDGLLDLPSVPDSNPTFGNNIGGPKNDQHNDNIDFDDLTKRFEELKKRK